MRALVGGLVAALILVSLSNLRAENEPTPAPTSAPATHPTSTDGFGPIAYYEEHCSRCHGQFGTGYLPDLGKRLPGDALRKVIAEMAEGPAAAPLDEAQLDAETAYHRSFIEGTPFIARTASDRLQGEVTDGATVVAVVGDARVPAVVEGQTWRVEGSIDSSKVQLVAELDGKRTVLAPGQAYSHGTRRGER